MFYAPKKCKRTKESSSIYADTRSAVFTWYTQTLQYLQANVHRLRFKKKLGKGLARPHGHRHRALQHDNDPVEHLTASVLTACFCSGSDDVVPSYVLVLRQFSVARARHESLHHVKTVLPKPSAARARHESLHQVRVLLPEPSVARARHERLHQVKNLGRRQALDQQQLVPRALAAQQRQLRQPHAQHGAHKLLPHARQLRISR